MTAIVCTVNEEGVLIYSDGASYDTETGFYGAPASKASIFLHHPSVVASKGSGRAAQYFDMFSSVYPTFDDLTVNAEFLMRESTSAAMESGDSHANFGVIVAGWSDMEKRFVGHWHWMCGADSDAEVQTENIPSNGYFSNWPPNEVMAERGLLKENEITFSGDADYINFFECLRATRFQFGPGSEKSGCIVGGFIQKTILKREIGLNQIIHRWPDVIGRPLNEGAVLRD